MSNHVLRVSKGAKKGEILEFVGKLIIKDARGAKVGSRNLLTTLL
jgi:hypothetical protein